MKIKLIDGVLPVRAHKYDAGADVHSAIDAVIEPGERKLIRTGFCCSVEPGFEIQVRPRSGLALKHGVTVLNAPGTIDASYRGEVGVVLINHGKEPFHIKRGDRIAQLVVASVVLPIIEEGELDSTDRGGGFGSTGR